MPKTLYKKIKIFINGNWIGITETPIELYKFLKNAKAKGLINIYTGVVFDYHNLEIRIRTDGGRLTRPVFKVVSGKSLFTDEVYEKIRIQFHKFIGFT